MGAKFVTFPKFQTSASQTETLFPHSSPPPSISPFILSGRQNTLSTSRETPASSVLHPIAPNPPPPSSIRPEPGPRCRRPLQEIDLSHPRLRTGILASRPLASSPPSSTLPAPLLRPSRPPRPSATVYPPRSASTPPTAIATAPPSNSHQMRTRHRTRGGTLSYLLNLFIAARK